MNRNQLKFSFFVNLQFRKKNISELVSSTIPRSGGYDTPQSAAKAVPKSFLGFISVIGLRQAIILLSFVITINYFSILAFKYIKY
jgi:hypothetical protein